MAGEITFFSSETVNSGGSTSESQKKNVQDSDTLTVEINGDSNATDLDIIARVNTIPGNELGRQDIISSENLTDDPNNCKVFQWDIELVAEIKLKLKNNAGSNTTVDAQGVSA